MISNARMLRFTFSAIAASLNPILISKVLFNKFDIVHASAVDRPDYLSSEKLLNRIPKIGSRQFV